MDNKTNDKKPQGTWKLTIRRKDSNEGGQPDSTRLVSGSYDEKRGFWFEYYHYCSECNKLAIDEHITQYCPNCGTFMGEVEHITRFSMGTCSLSNACDCSGNTDMISARM